MRKDVKVPSEILVIEEVSSRLGVLVLERVVGWVTQALPRLQGQRQGCSDANNVDRKRLSLE